MIGPLTAIGVGAGSAGGFGAIKPLAGRSIVAGRPEIAGDMVVTAPAVAVAVQLTALVSATRMLPVALAAF